MAPAFLLAALAVMQAGPATPDVGEAGRDIPVATEVVASGLDAPWDIAFLPSGDMLVTERVGRLRIVRNGTLLQQPVEGIPAVHVKSQAGLFEAVPHPDFSRNGYLYLTYAAGTADRNTLVLARGVYVETAAGARLDEVEVLFEADAVRDTSNHYGGRMHFLPDGTLLLTSGDGDKYLYRAPDLDTHFGKILRLTEDGAPARDNPFVGTEGALPEIWSYGHRNPQGIDIAPDGTVYANEHGPAGGDEVNVIRPGQDYGWPLVTRGVDYSGVPVTPFDRLPGRTEPLVSWTPSIAPSALHVYSGGRFGGLRGAVLSTALAGRHLRLVNPANPGDQVSLLAPLGVRLRDVTEGPDGALYVATEGAGGGEILRILPER